jgi:hypothetical protein
VIERSEIQFGLTPIPYLIRRSDRRTTVALTIEERGKLVVTAPEDVSIDRLNAVVRRKAPWVVERIKRRSDAPPPPSDREFVDGETVLYLGRQYRLKVVEATVGRKSRIAAGWYHVTIPRGLRGETRRLTVRRVLRGSVKERADLYLPGRLADVAARLRMEKPSLIVREQRKRWGSCDSKGVLRINWRIVQAPIPCIEYVLVHELAHLHHRNHDREFWRAVSRWLPGYEDERDRLRKLGPQLEW